MPAFSRARAREGRQGRRRGLTLGRYCSYNRAIHACNLSFGLAAASFKSGVTRAETCLYSLNAANI